MLEVATSSIQSIQATLFTPDHTFSQNKLLAFITGKWANVYDGDPISIPDQGGIPAEIPRIIGKSADNRHKAELSPARISIFDYRTTPQDDINVDEFLRFACNFDADLLGEIPMRVGRIAVVMVRYMMCPEPAQVLIDYCCAEKWRKEALEASRSFELHSHKQYTLSDAYNINSWIRFKTGSVSLGGEASPIIIIEQDINTLAEEANETSYEIEQIVQFNGDVSSEMDAILESFS